MNIFGVSISLLNAGLAVGLLAALLPTIIHLISRRRARHVRFAPMELLLRSQKRTARSIRLRQLALLLARTLFVVALALALLRPLAADESRAALTSAPIGVVIAVDVSASMQTRIDGRTAFDDAVAEAKRVVSGLPYDVKLGLVACDVVPREVVVPAFDHGAVVAAIDALRPTAAFADVSVCVSRASALLQAQVGENVGGDEAGAAPEGERRVVLISDLAAHGFPRGAVEGAGLRLEVRAVSDREAPPNHGITDITATPAGQGLGVRFTAVRFGPQSTTVPADLFVNGARGPRVVLDLESGAARVERTFSVPVDSAASSAGSDPSAVPSATPSSGGAGVLNVVLGDDALSIDNQVTLPDEARPRLKVLVVDGEPDAVPFADEVYYLTQALSSSRVGAAGQSRLDVVVVPTDRVDAAAIVDVDVIVLANVARLDPSAAAAVVSHTVAGHGLFITSGDQMDTEALNAQLRDVLPAVLRGAKAQALLDDASVDEVLGLGRFATEHPILRAFSGVAKDALPGLTRVRTRASMLVEPDPSSAGMILARFSNDAPALIERAVGPDGAGRVIFLATSIDREWTDLPIRPGFLPLMEQIILYLGRGLDDGRPRTVRVGELRALSLPPSAAGVIVTRPDGQEVRVDVVGNAATVTDTSQLGLYAVAIVTADGERRALPGERFSVLMDPREMDLSRVSDEQLTAALPAGTVVRRGGDDDDGTPLWPWLLLCAVLALAVESALSTRGDRAP
jgi:hypothetical protein